MKYYHFEENFILLINLCIFLNLKKNLLIITYKEKNVEKNRDLIQFLNKISFLITI